MVTSQTNSTIDRRIKMIYHEGEAIPQTRLRNPIKMKKSYFYISTPILAVSVAVFSAHSNAATIADLYNTGVNSSGTALADSITDPHYTLITSPSGTVTPAVTVPNGFPIPPWIANTSTSRWIGPNTTSADGPSGTYVYRTTFTLPSFTTAAITG